MFYLANLFVDLLCPTSGYAWEQKCLRYPGLCWSGPDGGHVDWSGCAEEKV